MSESKFNIESKENLKGELWVVDDNPCAYISLWQARLGIPCRQFFTGQEALQEISARKSENKDLPKIIIMDGILAGDRNTNFGRGENIIKRIRAYRDEISQPKIIAYSSDHGENSKMVTAGADAVLDKSADLLDSLDEIKKLLIT